MKNNFVRNRRTSSILGSLKVSMVQNTQIELDLLLAKSEDWHCQMLESLGVMPGFAWPDRFGNSLYKWFKKNEYPSISTLSLFSGAGGLDIAFHDSGFKVLEMVEIDPRFAETLEANSTPDSFFNGANVRCIDINDYTVPKNFKADFIIGGPPCQTFSAAGRRAAGVKGTNDPRGTLFEQYVRLLRTLKPRGFLFENVYGIIGAEGGEPWKEIQRTFRDSGYTLCWRVLDAADYGVPQHRERLFIVGLREGEEKYLFPYPTHGPDSITPRSFYTAEEAISGVEEDNLLKYKINGRWGHLIEDIPPGLNYSFYTPEMGHPKPIFAWRSKFSDFMYKADPKVPVRTIKAQGGLYTGPFSWENRHFSVSEIKRLQTFPDDYKLSGSRQICLHQIGNSVPPQIGRILALSIMHQIFGITPPFPMHYLPENRTLGFRSRKRALTKVYSEKAKIAIANLDKQKNNDLLQSVFPSEVKFYLTSSFDLEENNRKGSFPVRLKIKNNETSIIIDGEAINSKIESNSNFQYSIFIESSLGETWPIPLDNVLLIARSPDPNLFTSLWKTFEWAVAKKYGIDDLVQLSNYYQYSPRLKARLKVESGDFILLPEWHVLEKVVSGIGVAVQLSLDSFSEKWNLPQKNVISSFHFLRSIGYEVRSHNTNPQIKNGDFLIPYLFPTLKSRSVQLRKKI